MRRWRGSCRRCEGGRRSRAGSTFTADGAEHRLADSLARRPALYKIGQRVRLCYPPGQPDRALIGRWRIVGPFVAAATVGWGCVAAMLIWRMA